MGHADIELGKGRGEFRALGDEAFFGDEDFGDVLLAGRCVLGTLGLR